MSAHSLPDPCVLPQRPTLQLLKPRPIPVSVIALRLAFWTAGLLLAAAQAWVYRFSTTADSISYLDMSDGVLPGGSWRHLINGIWSPLYPLLIGVARRIFAFSPAHEIADAHWLNLGFFVFAFVGFEFFLRSALDRAAAAQKASVNSVAPLLPRWAYVSVAYSLFLWASLSGITLSYLRPDMLMSGFLYLAAGMLLRMQASPARWSRYLGLGVVLGIGYLAKAPMLPIGILVLAASLFVVERWRPAIKMVVAAFALTMAIGSLYFVPLSAARGHFTLGESSAFNYLVHVDLAQPEWYLQDPGRGRGSFTHPAEKIFLSPPAYAFALPDSGTHPLKFDSSYWIEGVRPRFVLRRQAATLVQSFSKNRELLIALIAAIALILVFGYRLLRRRDISVFLSNWPLCVVGAAGCVMYSLVHVEGRYVGPFLVLFWSGILLGLRAQQKLRGKLPAAIALVIVASLLLPVGWLIYKKRSQGMGRVNTAALVADELERVGVRAGDQVACICPSGKGSGLGVERIARLTVVAEVDLDRTDEFWSLPVTAQQDLLQIFAVRGAKAVIAVSPKLDATNQSEWTRLGSTPYWVWRPAS